MKTNRKQLSVDRASRKSPSPLVSVTGVVKQFENGIIALEGVNFTVRDGEFLSLLGASGSGKTTILRLLAGLLTPTSGDIAWRGKTRPHEIGFVFQEPALMPWATVTANVRLPLRLLGTAVRTTEMRAAAMLEKVGLKEFAQAYPRELSGGMKMRASLARALILKPKLLLLDEPFAALDEITRFQLDDELLSLWREFGCTVVFVTHSVAEAAYLSTRTLLLSPRPGRIVEEVRFLPSILAKDTAYRTSADFAARSRKLSNALERAMRLRA